MTAIISYTVSDDIQIMVEDATSTTQPDLVTNTAVSVEQAELASRAKPGTALQAADQIGLTDLGETAALGHS